MQAGHVPADTTGLVGQRRRQPANGWTAAIQEWDVKPESARGAVLYSRQTHLFQEERKAPMFHPTPWQSLNAMRAAAVLYAQRCRERERARYWHLTNVSAHLARIESARPASLELPGLLHTRAGDLVGIPFVPSRRARQLRTVRARRHRGK